MTQRSRRTRHLGLAVLAAAVSLFGLAACGDSGSTTTTTTAPGTSGATTTAKASTTTANSSGDFASQVVAGFNAIAKGDCKQAQQLNSSFSSSGLLSGAVPDFGQLADGLKAASTQAPAEIKADLATLADTFKVVADTLKSLGVTDPTKIASIASDPAKAAELQKLGDLFDDAKVQQATDRLEAWLKGKCPGLT